jgi:penicillin-binding protein 1A
VGRAFRIIGILLILLVCSTGGAVLGAASWLGHDLPSTSDLERIDPPVKTQVFDVHGQVIGEFFKENRTLVPLNQVPKNLTNAFIATEDRRFYRHWGVDIFRIGKAAMKDIATRSPAEGGGTITQQLARNLFLTHEKTLSRKLKETMLALEIERRYTKDEILAMYENQIYFGDGAYGVQAAARTFFGKDVQNLTLPECALLAGLPRDPSGYNPRRHPDIARRRRQIVLHGMLETGKITRAQYTAAAAAPLGVIPRPSARSAPYFLETVRQYLDDKYGSNLVYEGGLRVYTTLDLNLQRLAEEALERHLSELEIQNHYRFRLQTPTTARSAVTGRARYIQGAMLALDARTGAVRVMIGGRNFSDSPFNRVLQARRQTGSLWKPFVYTAAIDRGAHPTDTISDTPVQYPAGNGTMWAPHNYDNKFRGTITLRYALQHSVNIPAVRLASEVGTQTVAEYARRLGIASPVVTNLSMALGTTECTLIEMMSAYLAFDNSGVRPTPFWILKVVDRNGTTLEATRPRLSEVLSEETAVTINSMLQSVFDGGTAYTARLAGFTRPAAGKTGTTSNYTDAWFIGYTPTLEAGVWVGFDRKQQLGEGMTGARAALPIWTAFMLRATQNQPVADFPHPTLVVTRTICPVSGLLATVNCPEPFSQTFTAGEEPNALCDVHPGEPLDQAGPPTDITPPEAVDDERQIPPDEETTQPPGR